MGQEVQVAPIFAGKEVEQLEPKEVQDEKDQRKRWNKTAVLVRSEHEFIWVESTHQLYCKDKEGVLYQPVEDRQLDRWVGEAVLRNYGAFSTRDIDEVTKQLKLIVTEEISAPSLDCIMVTENIFWDRVNGELTRTPTGPVFYRLMSTKKATKHTPIIPKLTAGQEDALWNMYGKVKEELNKGEQYEERFEPLKVWANGNHDVYQDLHRAHAYMMLKKKPMGSYVLIGVARNGKSAYVGFTKAIVGLDNSSDIQISALTNYRLNHELSGVLINAPDEEDEKILDMAAMFKTMSDHGILTLEVMRSQEPIEVDCDFMCFFPMNHNPDWRGSGAMACMKRSLIIPFTADLSKFDKTNDNFAERTFTADFMAEYLGSMFAYAWYYHRHELEFSSTMLEEQGELEENVASCATYKRKFDRYFDGYDTIETLHTDYANWCKEHSLLIQSTKTFKMYFKGYTESTIRLPNGKTKRVNRRGKEKHRLLYKEFMPPEYSNMEDIDTVSKMHAAGMSLVGALDDYYAQKYEEGVMNEPSR